jgi:hypothetical protein
MEKSQMVVGKKYKVTGGTLLNVGDILTFVALDSNSGGDFIRDSDGYESYKRYENVEEVGTPAELAGIKVGIDYELTRDFHGFPVGTIVTLVKDDGSTMPYFQGTYGSRIALKFDEIKLYVKPLTPMEKKGYKLGDKFIVTRNSNFNEGDIIEFTRDDDSDIPFFTKLGKTYEDCENMACIAPYVPTPAQAAGLVVGKKYKLTRSEGAFDEGEVVTFSRDDGSRCPAFTTVRGGTYYAYITSVEAFVPEVAFTDYAAFTSITTNVKLSQAQKDAIKAIVEAA